MTTKAFAVVIEKRPGIEVVFSRYESAREADLIVSKLAAFGCKARASDALPDDAPGATRSAIDSSKGG